MPSNSSRQRKLAHGSAYLPSSTEPSAAVEIGWEAEALDAAAGFLRHDASGVARVFDAVDLLAHDPRPPGTIGSATVRRTGGAETVLSLDLEPDGTGTHARLTQAGFLTDKAAREHEHAWHVGLRNLDALLSDT